MTILNRPATKKHYLEILMDCATCLLDKWSNERGLYRSLASQLEVRRLKLQLYKGNKLKILINISIELFYKLYIKF